MKRKDYQTPSMTVVELRHQCCILAGSDPLQSYSNDGGDAWSGGSGSGGSKPDGWTDNGGDAWK